MTEGNAALSVAQGKGAAPAPHIPQMELSALSPPRHEEDTLHFHGTLDDEDLPPASLTTLLQGRSVSCWALPQRRTTPGQSAQSYILFFCGKLSASSLT